MLKKSEEIESTESVTIVGFGVKFQRIRRITGYLVGEIKRFNDAKYRELYDRTSNFGDIGKKVMYKSD